MESIFAFRRSSRAGFRWTLVSLSIAIATVWQTFAWGNCIENLQGKIYIDLPQPVCPRYTDLLLGRTDPEHEYAGVICDRPEASYILLQRLVKYTDQGKAVWQVVRVKSVPRSTPESYVRFMGCELQPSLVSNSSTEPVFALVQPTVTDDNYLTLTAWKVNLLNESFTDLEPTQVICKNALL